MSIGFGALFEGLRLVLLVVGDLRCLVRPLLCLRKWDVVVVDDCKNV